MVTIDDIAKKAGVSKGTVSNVFSKKRPASAVVTEKIMKIAQELNYSPNQIARSLATKKTMTIALKMPISSEFELSAFETKVINGVVKKCSEFGYRVLLDRFSENSNSPLYSNDPVDGVILLNPCDSDTRVLQYKRFEMPFVLIGRPEKEDGGTYFVDNNNVEIVKEVGEYLIGNGHKRILFFNASPHMTVAEDRKEGLKQAFENYNLEFIEENVLYYNQSDFENSSDYGYRSLLEKFSSDKFTAVITDTDRVALGAMRASRELGINVPGDLSIVALGNNETLALETTPKLTSVELFPDKLGQEAAEVLLNVLNKTPAPRKKMISAKLVIRDS
ncbi:LacI family DNA-binding transcriptional regulator [Virgibacillus litoralis]|uniref:DNA-binding LacI/PurR family transcriptional regulator n=1 Tax=Virgibacillus litoralis TaxID=578221 RepID=A0ABS4HAV7_9BACI|nr:LacI family DNA-binding transcriptional regulator [Virgibacillus litoralis]MBP1947884.1 DNA-binding LacI/PurR family transcriptional regulator [Virgibacillus litoralis]